MEEPDKKQFYYLIVGEVYFTTKETEALHSIRMNGLLTTESKDIPVRLLGRAQQILQATFLNKMGKQNATITDAVISNLICLGEFTKDAFFAVPENTKLAEMIIPAGE